MHPCKHQRSKQGGHDLGCQVYEHAHYYMHELHVRNHNVSIGKLHEHT